MSHVINETHDPTLESWVDSANRPGTDFPIQNLPFGAFSQAGQKGWPRLGVAIGDFVLDLAACHEEELLDGLDGDLWAACLSSALNALMGLGPEASSTLRRRLVDLLRVDNRRIADDGALQARILVPMDQARMSVPAMIGDYTDFYASISHATKVGSMFRPDNPLLPNYKYIPVGYHGRASSVVVAGTKVRRPWGQTAPEEGETPIFGPTRSLDYELEVGFFVGRGNTLGHPVAIGRAQEHLFGFCLLNDWSARDIQKWEYQPLGPFLAKSFATSVSPWVVTTEALAPYRCEAFPRAPGDPPPLPYLLSESDRRQGGFDVTLEVLVSSEQMRREKLEPMRFSRGNLRDMYWTPAQMLAHHASNGCNLRPGDLLGTGTVSGAEQDARGCLLELTWRGKEPIVLPTGEQRRFLEDGDEVIFRGWCEREGFARLGFGTCSGIVQPAVQAASVPPFEPSGAR